MRVGCRWPGGMTIFVKRSGGDPITVKLTGPSGKPSVLPKTTKKLPSQYVAHLWHKQVVDTVHQMKETSALDPEPMDYGVTEISGAFWDEWFAQNADFDVVKHRMVFAL